MAKSASETPFSPKKFLEEKMNAQLREDSTLVEGWDCVFEFRIEGSTWNLDLTDSRKAPQIQPGSCDTKPDCAIEMSAENFEKLVKGKLNVPLAFVTGKFKIQGDKTLALKLAKLFG